MLSKEETIRILKEYPILRVTAENLQQQLQYKKAAGADKQEIESLCRKLTETNLLKNQLDRGLSVLTDEEHLILELMYITPVKGRTMTLCEMLEVELATVYRRRNKAIEKLRRAMPIA